MSITQPAMLRLIDGNGAVAGEFQVPHAAEPAWERDVHRPVWAHLDQFVEWRKTKCMPRDYNDPAQQMEDINQATHEFVGEVAEMGEMVLQHGGDCFRNGHYRIKFLGEIGDVFFTGSWLMDAYGHNALLDVPSGDPGNILYDAQVRDWDLRRVALNRLLAQFEYDAAFWAHIYSTVVFAQGQAGLLCNSYKKLRYQQRPQVISDQIRRVVMVLEVAAKLGVLADASIQDALENNVKKLDFRYPEGYQGPGGGNRTGVGA